MPRRWCQNGFLTLRSVPPNRAGTGLGFRFSFRTLRSVPLNRAGTGFLVCICMHDPYPRILGEVPLVILLIVNDLMLLLLLNLL